MQEAALYRVGNGRGYIPPPGARIPPPGWTYISGDLNEGAWVRGRREYLLVLLLGRLVGRWVDYMIDDGSMEWGEKKGVGSGLGDGVGLDSRLSETKV